MNACRLLTVMAALTGLFASAGCNGILTVRETDGASACVSSTDCSSGQICVGGFCTFDNNKNCWIFQDGACPAGETCVDGICSAQYTQWCDCADPTQGCLDGVCVNISEDTGCSSSLTDGACVNGSVCVAGTCVSITPGNICTANRLNGLCPSGTGCDNGICVPIQEDQCTQANPHGLCQAGAICQSGACVILPCSVSNQTGACTDHGDFCQNGTCVALPCSPQNVNGPCQDPTTFCSAQGTCITKGTCTGDGDCDAGNYCTNAGVCRTNGTCVDNNDCDQFSLCTGNVCVANPNCSDDAHCPAGEHCLDEPNGTCQPTYACSVTHPDPTDCDSGEYCSASGQCVPTSQCLSNADCGDTSGRCTTGPCVCGVTGVCIQQGHCQADGDCGFAETCQSATGNCNPSESCTKQYTASSGTNPPTCPGGGCCADADRRCTLTAPDSKDRCVTVGRCVDNDDCAPGAGCNLSDNTCTVQSCNGNGDCTQGGSCNTATHTCSGGTPCTASSCGAGKFCSELGVCLAGTAHTNCGIIDDCTGGNICSGNFLCVGGANCGGQEFAAQIVQPNMLILLDRSGSMNWNTSDDTNRSLGTPGCETQNVKRWQTALAAINTVTTEHADNIRFGLSTFPSNDNCGGAFDCSSDCNNTCMNKCDVAHPPSGSSNTGSGESDGDNCEPGYVDVQVGDIVQHINDSLAANRPGGRTPTQRALAAIAADRKTYGLPQVPNDGRDNFILLITDGEPNCTGAVNCPSSCVTHDSRGRANGCDANCEVGLQLDALLSLTPPIRTFTVGFAFSSVNHNLNCNAVHGGTSLCDASVTTANCGSTSNACYYQANSPSALATALDSITREVAGGCTLQLQDRPADITKLYVFFRVNGTVQPDPLQQGTDYTYDSNANQIQLIGGACDHVKNDGYQPKVVYGCPNGGS